MATNNSQVQWEQVPFWKWLVITAAVIIAGILVWLSVTPLLAEWYFRQGFTDNAYAENHSNQATKEILYKSALENLKKAYQYAPWETYYEVNLGRSYEQYAMLIASTEQRKPEALELLNKAEAHYQNAIEISPVNPWYHNRLAAVYRFKLELNLEGPQKQAEYLALWGQELTLAQQYDKNNPLFNMSAGFYYHSTGRDAENNPYFLSENNLIRAQEYYEQALKADFAFSEAYYNLGEIYLQRDNREKAKEMYIRCGQTMSQHLERKTFANCYWQLGRIYIDEENYPSASAALEAEVQIQPSNQLLLSDLSQLYYQQQQWYNAINTYRKILYYNSNNFPIRVRLGYAYARLGKYKEAYQQYQTVLKYADPASETYQDAAKLARNIQAYAL